MCRQFDLSTGISEHLGPHSFPVQVFSESSQHIYLWPAGCYAAHFDSKSQERKISPCKTQTQTGRKITNITSVLKSKDNEIKLRQVIQVLKKLHHVHLSSNFLLFSREWPYSAVQLLFMCDPPRLCTVTCFTTAVLMAVSPLPGLQSSAVCNCYGTDILVLECPLQRFCPHTQSQSFLQGSTHIRLEEAELSQQASLSILSIMCPQQFLKTRAHLLTLLFL